MREYLSILVTLSPDDLAALKGGSVERVYRSVWGAVTTFLTPELGKWFDSFYPSPTPWEQPAPPSLFGTVLGKVAPNLFRRLLTAAGVSQETYVKLHQRRLLHDVLGAVDLSALPEFLVKVVPVEARSEAAAHVFWLGDFSSGKLVPYSSLYCLPQGKHELSKSEVKAIMDAPERYALCTVELHKEVKDEGEV